MYHPFYALILYINFYTCHSSIRQIPRFIKGVSVLRKTFDPLTFHNQHTISA